MSCHHNVKIALKSIPNLNTILKYVKFWNVIVFTEIYQDWISLHWISNDGRIFIWNTRDKTVCKYFTTKCNNANNKIEPQLKNDEWYILQTTRVHNVTCNMAFNITMTHISVQLNNTSQLLAYNNHTCNNTSPLLCLVGYNPRVLHDIW